MKRRTVLTLPLPAAAAAIGLPALAQPANRVLRVVPHANLTILDPIWSTAFVTRNHGYMLYDTLFGTDLEGRVRPQMVDKWSVSRDNLLWTFSLREGLEFHDGAPVTAEDVVASLRRWSTRDSFGQVLARSVDAWQVQGPRAFAIKLKTPFGVMLEALGKPSSNVPFVMPARIAATPGTEQIKEHVGSGPFRFVPAEFKPGERVVYLRNEKYRPRAEPPNGTTGGKVVNVDRVEWVIIRDPQTQFNALVAGEVDIVEQPTFEQYASLKAQKDVKIEDAQPAGLQYIFRPNHLHPPFNNPKIRQAAMAALGQEAFLKTQVGAPGMFRYCKSIYPCGTPFASENTGAYTGTANPQRAAQLLKEAGYDGTPVVLMRPTDLATIAKLPLVAKQQLEAAGFKVDMQQMDWSTLVARRARKDPPDKGGWNAFLTAWTAGDIQNPLTMAMLNAAGDKGWFGWQDDAVIEELKVKFAQATSDAEKKRVAEQIQLRAIETVSHVHLGQFNNPAAMRRNVEGLVPAGAQVYWNIRKT